MYLMYKLYFTEFNGELFEGDIILPPNLSRAGRRTNRWPGGVFYYHLTSGISTFYTETRYFLFVLFVKVVVREAGEKF